MDPAAALTLLFLGKGRVLLFKSSTLLIRPSTLYQCRHERHDLFRTLLNLGIRPSAGPLATRSSLSGSWADLARATGHKGLMGVGAEWRGRDALPLVES